jgi:hypothetical protein
MTVLKNRYDSLQDENDSLLNNIAIQEEQEKISEPIIQEETKEPAIDEQIQSQEADTLSDGPLIEKQAAETKEQAEEEMNPEGQDPQFDTSGGQDPAAEGGDVLDNPEPVEDETMPLTSEGEDRYISDMIDAALFEPSAEDARILQNFQSVMKMKRYKNAREEILPTLLNIIRPKTEENDIRSQLNNV